MPEAYGMARGQGEEPDLGQPERGACRTHRSAPLMDPQAEGSEGIPMRTARSGLSTAHPHGLLERRGDAQCQFEVTVFCRHPEDSRPEATDRRWGRTAENVGQADCYVLLEEAP